jgi:hypothetical protein
MTFMNLAQGDRYRQRAMPMGWPVCLNVSALGGLYGWLLLPRGWAISYNVDPELEERVVWERGQFTLTRPETEDEYLERQYEYDEWVMEQRDLNRYTEWSY